MLIAPSFKPAEEENTSIERPIVPQDKWDELSFTELTAQKEILYNRWEFLRNKGYAYHEKLLEGLNMLEKKIQEKAMF